MSRLYEALQNAYADRGAARAPAAEPIPDDRELTRLYQSLEASLGHLRHRIVLLTAPHGGAGTTTLCSRLGRLANLTTGRPSLILGVSMRRPRRHTAAPTGRTMPDHVGGVAQTVVADIGEYVPADVLTNAQALRRSWEDLSQSFGWILVDAPPVGDSPLTLALAPNVDAVLLVLRWGVTRNGAARRARDRILETGANLAGAVINRRKRILPP